MGMAPYHSNPNFSCPIVALFSSTLLLSMKNLGSKNYLGLRLAGKLSKAHGEGRETFGL